ncbi:hypothetical protein FM120_22455 [Sphingobacterium faecium PCAi_F2.5]|nr:hypothetical protein FM120_22455 [Sphingobacterium faecium PCAi_F2.5]
MTIQIIVSYLLTNVKSKKGGHIGNIYVTHPNNLKVKS